MLANEHVSALSLFLLALHGAIVAGTIHRHATLVRDLGSQLHRETMGIIEFERQLAGHLMLSGLLQRIQFACEQLHAQGERLVESALFGADDIDNLIAPRRQFRVVALHEANHGVGGLRRGKAPPGRASCHGAPRGAAPGGRYSRAPRCSASTPSARQEDERASVIGDHPQRLVVLGVLAVGRSARGRRTCR